MFTLEPLQPLPELWEQSVGLFDYEDFHGLCPALVNVPLGASMPTGTQDGRWPLRYLLLVDLMVRFGLSCQCVPISLHRICKILIYA